MSEQLQIEQVRNELIRLEETIIFALIERAQFMRNAVIYDPGRFGSVLEGESLVGFMLLDLLYPIKIYGNTHLFLRVAKMISI
jgi:hypothetical protein